jgi:hypothetical protein
MKKPNPFMEMIAKKKEAAAGKKPAKAGAMPMKKGGVAKKTVKKMTKGGKAC